MVRTTDEKVFFRVEFENQILRYRLSASAPLHIMFMKVTDRLDCFMWRGSMLNGSLTPSEYNMLPGREHCVEIYVALTEEQLLREIDAIAHAIARNEERMTYPTDPRAYASIMEGKPERSLEEGEPLKKRVKVS